MFREPHKETNRHLRAQENPYQYQLDHARLEGSSRRFLRIRLVLVEVPNI
jgi:hypothetical protein